MKKFKKVIPVVIAFIIGISTTVGAATIFNSKDITYSSSATSKTNVKDSLDELYSKAANVGKCPEGKWCIDNKITNIVNIGDYINMTPTSTSYTPTKEDTGCLNDSNCTQNTINPSELILWRVIRKNDNGTIDMVSEYVSSINIYFRGETGYLNLVGGLNTIAAQYTNPKYVQSTRHMGFSNQTEKCTTLYNCSIDTGYEVDTGLVETAIGTLVGSNLRGTATDYWLSSRNETRLSMNTAYCGRSISSFISNAFLYRNDYFAYSNGSAIRPILTLKSDVQIKSGDGKSASTAYQLV